MNILVISDSHGRRERIEEAVERQIKKPDAIIFLGDGLRDITRAEIGDMPIYTVSGNCDMGGMFCEGAPTEQNLILGEKRIFFTHGHRYGVKSTLSPLISEAVGRGAQIVLFGHTHAVFEKILTCDNEYGIKVDAPIYIMNPGSIGEYPYRFGSITVNKNGEILLSHGALAQK